MPSSGRLPPKARASKIQIVPRSADAALPFRNPASGCDSAVAEPICHGGLPQTHNGSRSPPQRAPACDHSPRSPRSTRSSRHQLPALQPLEPHPPTTKLPRPCPSHPHRKGRSGHWLRAHVPSRPTTRRQACFPSSPLPLRVELPLTPRSKTPQTSSPPSPKPPQPLTSSTASATRC